MGEDSAGQRRLLCVMDLAVLTILCIFVQSQYQAADEMLSLAQKTVRVIGDVLPGLLVK